MNKGKMRRGYFGIIVLLALFIQGCAIARWHNQMMQSAMGCMGMGGQDDHGDQQESAGLVSASICHTAAYLDQKEELGLTLDQIEKLKSLSISCQKEIISKEAEVKTAGIDYQALLDNLAKNKAERDMVEGKGREIGKLYTQMFLIPLDYQEKARAILTTEQKERLGSVSSPVSKNRPAKPLNFSSSLREGWVVFMS
jgi:hypothetical protein